MILVMPVDALDANAWERVSAMIMTMGHDLGQFQSHPRARCRAAKLVKRARELDDLVFVHRCAGSHQLFKAL